MKGQWFQNFQLWLRKGLKLAPGIKVICWSSRNILLCIMGQLAGGGTMALAVGFSDMWQVKRNTRHATHDTWHVTHDLWLVTCDTWLWLWLFALVTCGRWHATRDMWHLPCNIFFILFYFIVWVLLSAYVERLSVSRMRDIFFLLFNTQCKGK